MRRKKELSNYIAGRWRRYSVQSEGSEDKCRACGNAAAEAIVEGPATADSHSGTPDEEEDSFPPEGSVQRETKREFSASRQAKTADKVTLRQVWPASPLSSGGARTISRVGGVCCGVPGRSWGVWRPIHMLDWCEERAEFL